MHLGRLQIDSNAFSIVCAIQVLLLWLRLQYFARVLQPTKNPFIETIRAVISEVTTLPLATSNLTPPSPPSQLIELALHPGVAGSVSDTSL